MNYQAAIADMVHRLGYLARQREEYMATNGKYPLIDKEIASLAQALVHLAHAAGGKP